MAVTKETPASRRSRVCVWFSCEAVRRRGVSLLFDVGLRSAA